ncbi:SRPBCC family protein [Salegentibacter flavus]|uniref:Effector-binding domain-containing protein n=1 Tax=Salegentibacter flavus TaxID=287099 RepID=A0A1I4ZF33_9FLAO|nr:GyrI-like domain-containing protein [Salegentibacter flavus]SFN48884.1 effector-binding domain-containing protein [Salegentibacter flavus]
MKIIKYLLFLLLIIVIAGSIYIATKDGEYHIEETRIIPAPVEVIFNEVNEYHNWKNWEPWSLETDDMVVEYDEKTRGKDAGYSWKSESMGDGKIKTLDAKPFSSIDQEINFDTPFGTSTSDIYWEFNQMEDSTKVTWGMKGTQSFMEKLAFSFQSETLSEMMRPMFRKGLENLENSVIKKMEKFTINIDGVIQHGGGYYMYTTTATKTSQVNQRVQKMIADVRTYMEENNIEISGKPFTLYNERDENAGTAIFSAGIFTPSQVVTPNNSRVLNGNLPNQKVLRATLKGDYKNLPDAWNTAYDYIEEHSLELNEEEDVFEVYITGPKSSSNPADWVTQIHFPIK